MIHEILLEKYGAARADGVSAAVSLGTADSYGLEQLRITPGEGWEGLTITATFHPPSGDPVRVLVPEDGLLDVPPEATTSTGRSCRGKIVFAGVTDGVQRISCDLIYTVKLHAPVEGNESSATPDLLDQVLAEVQATREAVSSSAGGGVSNDYYYHQTLGALNKAIGNLEDLQTEDKSSLVAAINEAAKTGGSTGGLDSSQNANGLTTAQITALDAMFKVTAFSTDPASAYAAFKEAFGIAGDDTGGSGGDTGGSDEDSGETETVTYTITNNLTNVSNNNGATSVSENKSYTAILTADDGYALNSVTVLMGGTDITSTAYSNGKINISAVTGNISVQAVAVIEPNDTPSDYTWLYDSANGSVLSARTDIVTVNTNTSYGTVNEKMNTDGNLHLVATATGAGGSYYRYKFVDATCTKGELSARIKFNAVASGASTGGSGFRLQLSNGTAGGQIFEHIDTDGICHFVVYEGSVSKRIGTFEKDVWYTIKLVFDSASGYSIYVDGVLLYETATLSTNYCTMNAVLNQASDLSSVSENGHTSDVEIDWIAYKKVS